MARKKAGYRWTLKQPKDKEQRRDEEKQRREMGAERPKKYASFDDAVADVMEKAKRVWVKPGAKRKGHYRMDPRTKHEGTSGAETGGEEAARITEELRAAHHKAERRLQAATPGTEEYRSAVAEHRLALEEWAKRPGAKEMLGRVRAKQAEHEAKMKQEKEDRIDAALARSVESLDNALDLLKAGKTAKAKGITEKDVDPKQLAMGIKVEMEHTNDEAEAKQTALDHLAEKKDYYTKLKKMEAQKSFGEIVDNLQKGKMGIAYLRKMVTVKPKKGRTFSSHRWVRSTSGRVAVLHGPRVKGEAQWVGTEPTGRKVDLEQKWGKKITKQSAAFGAKVVKPETYSKLRGVRKSIVGIEMELLKASKNLASAVREKILGASTGMEKKGKSKEEDKPEEAKGKKPAASKKPEKKEAPPFVKKSVEEALDASLDLLKCDKAKWGKAKKVAKEGYPKKGQKERWPIVQKVYQGMKGKKSEKSVEESLDVSLDLLKAKRVWVKPSAKKKGHYRQDPRGLNSAQAVGEYHQKQVARGSLRMHPAMLGVMGGPSKEEARKILGEKESKRMEAKSQSEISADLMKSGMASITERQGLWGEDSNDFLKSNRVTAAGQVVMTREGLEKALNRAGLTKKKVTVKGKTKTYQAYRYTGKGQEKPKGEGKKAGRTLRESLVEPIRNMVVESGLSGGDAHSLHRQLEDAATRASQVSMSKEEAMHPMGPLHTVYENYMVKFKKENVAKK